MKNIYISFLFIFFLDTALSQPKLPFPDSTGSWGILECINGGPCVTYRYYVNGDTLLNGVSYNRLFRGSSDINDTSTWSCGFYRVDSLKVFYKFNDYCAYGQPSDTNEVLLYDFGMQPGDSIYVPPTINLFNGFYSKVQYIDTVNINGYLLRRWNFYPNIYIPYNNFWIEGIGSRIGFFNYEPVLDMHISLTCFNIYNEDYVIDIGNASSCQAVGEPDNYNSKNNIFPFPNPTNGKFIVKTGLDQNISTICITDIFGRRIKNITFNESVNNPGIDISDHPSGIYFIHIKSAQSYKIIKVMKE
ncbi:MAG: T9SS type A sorting domain-containing protein [Bacteroidota bacterium]